MKKLYRKFDIQKTDGAPVDLSAQYFVLRIDTSHAARVALRAYAVEEAKQGEIEFANQLIEWIEQNEFANQLIEAKRAGEIS